MPQELVSPEEFLTKLKQEFASDPSSSGTVWLTHKRYTHGVDVEEPMTNEDSTQEYEVLIRCTHNNTKFSSRIPSTSLPTFTQTYSTLIKTSLAPHMRKRDKKREKAKAEMRDKKRKEVYVDVEIGEGGKRGAGHRQRMRKVAAQRKKEAEREKIEARESKRDL